MGFALDPEAVARFERYAAQLVVWNARVNLTRITRPDEIALQHFLDSLVCLRALPPGADAPEAALACIDVGTGAGLPGLALKIVRPAWRLTLVEAVGKKVAFLEHVVGTLGLVDVTIRHARAEDLGRDPAHRERYDLAVARAVAPLATLAEYLLPFVRPAGRMVAQKGEVVLGELAAAGPAIALLGGHLLETLRYEIPGLAHARHLVVVEKVQPTPAAYPRRAGLPAREPLAG